MAYTIKTIFKNIILKQFVSKQMYRNKMSWNILKWMFHIFHYKLFISSHFTF